MDESLHTRRRLLRGLVGGVATAGISDFLSVPGLFAQALTLTPAQTEGPFYPTRLPLDTDNDLIVLNDGLTPAVGEITHVTGRILDAKGNPIRNALVEIWQVDNHGAYIHEGTANAERRDKNFQGFGRFLTGSTGEYYFRTIKPVSYPGRTPHIHYAVKMKGRDKWTTQCYIKGEPANERDRIWQSLGDARSAVTVDFVPVKGSPAGELTAHFEIVMDVTPVL